MQSVCATHMWTWERAGLGPRLEGVQHPACARPQQTQRNGMRPRDQGLCHRALAGGKAGGNHSVALLSFTAALLARWLNVCVCAAPACGVHAACGPAAL